MSGLPQSRLGWASFRGNAVAVLTARLLVPALNIALVVSIARGVGAEALGRYTLLVTLFLLWENLKSLGLPNLFTREIARHGVQALVYYRSLVRIGAVGAMAGVVAMTAIAGTNADRPRELMLAAGVMALGLFPSAFALANDALFLALGRSRISTLLALFENLVRLVASLAVVLVGHGSLLALAGIYALTRLLAVLTAEIVLRRSLQLKRPAHDPRSTRAMLREAPAFVTVFVLPMLLYRLDVILLAVLVSDFAVGIYGAAMRLVGVAMMLPDSFMTVSFAMLSKLGRPGDVEAFRSVVRSSVLLSAVVLTPISLALVLGAPRLMQLLYGGAFAGAAPILQVLAWIPVPFALGRAIGDALVARGDQRRVARAILATLGISVALFVVLIGRAQALGAAWACLGSIVVLMALLTIEQARSPVPVVRPALVAAAFAPVVVGLVAFRLPPAAAGGLAGMVGVAAVALSLAGVTALAMSAARRLPVPALTRTEAGPAIDAVPGEPS